HENLKEDCKLMIDMGTALYTWKPEQVIRFAKEIDKFDIFWLENPTRRYDFPGLRKIRKTINVSLAMGEQYYLLEDFKP
ncbi:MAG: enolase C-terminal domain-like protein, partial [Nitrososphaeria archaeon]